MGRLRCVAAINVGTRQDGREHGANVIDVRGDQCHSCGARRPRRQPSRRCSRQFTNPYGDGRASERIVRVLTTADLGPSLLVKRASTLLADWWRLPPTTTGAHYRRYACDAAYCDGVDRLIASWLPSQASTMLDVGSGDGVRAVQLASSLGIDALCSDPSQPMSEQCRSHHRGTVLTCAAEALPSNAGAFDVITCVWNVLGAIEEPERRLAALHGMKERLALAGLFVDVHNRYNVAAAGLRRVVARMARDLVTPSQANGLVSFTWRSTASAFQPADICSDPEMRRLFAAARLTPVRHAFVHYDTGQVCGRWRGQMVWALEHVPHARDTPLRRVDGFACESAGDRCCAESSHAG